MPDFSLPLNREVVDRAGHIVGVAPRRRPLPPEVLLSIEDEDERAPVAISLLTPAQARHLAGVLRWVADQVEGEQ